MKFKNDLGQTIFERSYAQKKEDGTYETYEEACRRVAKFAALTEDQVETFYKLLVETKIIPAGRWWYGSGKEFPQIFNCFVIPTGGPENLGKFCHDLCVTLMTGGGVGSNYSEIPTPSKRTSRSLPCYPELFISKTHPDFASLMQNYPHLIKELPQEGGQELQVGFRVKDTREGWGVAVWKAAEAIYHCQEVALNLSDIRPKGMELKAFGGIAAGPEALIVMISGILNVVLRRYLKQETLGPIDWMRIANCISRGIMIGGFSGGRRGAQMAMLYWQHASINKFITCKDIDGELEGMNISVAVDNAFVSNLDKKGSKAERLYNRLMKHACTHGEPGIWNQQEARRAVKGAITTNPCGEQSLEPYGCCNLGHINLAAHKSFDEIINSAKVLSELLFNGTIKTKLPLPEMYKQVDQNRRIGVGILGLHSWLVGRGKQFAIDTEDEIFFRQLYGEIRAHVDQYARKLRLNIPETVTTVAPTGTVSFLAGVTTGIEPMFCASYKRRYYSGQTLQSKIIVDPLAQECLAHGVPVQDAFSLSIKEHLDVQIKIQHTFVDNSVSKTINLPTVGTFDIEEVKREVKEALKQKIKGVTIYPNGARGNQPIEPVKLDLAAQTEQEVQECPSGACEL